MKHKQVSTLIIVKIDLWIRLFWKRTPRRRKKDRRTKGHRDPSAMTRTTNRRSQRRNIRIYTTLDKDPIIEKSMIELLTMCQGHTLRFYMNLTRRKNGIKKVQRYRYRRTLTLIFCIIVTCQSG